MTVVPMGAVLNNGKFIQMCRMGLNRILRKIRNTVVPVWQKESMPMQGCFFVEIIVHPYFCRVAFCKCQCRHRNGSIDRNSTRRFFPECYEGIGNVEIVTDSFLGKDYWYSQQ